MSSKLVWHRFEACYEDPRPIKWPPLGPYWITGYAGDSTYAIVVAYLPKGANIHEWWPEAVNIDVDEDVELQFTDRFPKPDWWGESDD